MRPCRPVRERLAAHREAGVGTLVAAPTAWTQEDRLPSSAGSPSWLP